MSFYEVIKKNARLALQGKWRGAIGVFALAFGVAGALVWAEKTALSIFVPYPFQNQPPADYAHYLRALLSYSPLELVITAISMVLFLLILAPVLLGITRWFYVLIQGRQAAFVEVFYFFESLRRYGRAIWYTVQLIARTLAWGVVFMILPGGVMGVSVYFLRMEGLARQTRTAASAGVMLAFGMLALAVLLYAIHINKYALAAYLLCESDDVSVMQAFGTSAKYTKGYRGIKLLFTISFAGWYLISPLTFFLLLLFVIPYHAAGETVFARYLVEKNRFQEPQATREFGGVHPGGIVVSVPPRGARFD